LTLSIRFWGVRGSVPAPGPATAQVGGNTTCVEVLCGAHRIVLDAGTGLRALGQALAAADAPVQATCLFTHVHWDHIQGLPFFSPLFSPTTKLDLYGALPDHDLAQVLSEQMRPPNFPVPLAQVPATLRFFRVPVDRALTLGATRIRAVPLNHPNGVVAYRLEHGGRSVVFATDTEHYPDGRLDTALVELARGADVLIYDAQYTPDEYAGHTGCKRHGWGHSTWLEGVRVARAAEAKKLILFHHDPSHDDTTVDAIESAAAEALPGTIAAREGLALSLAAQSSAVAA
jgi:phosphoribosyl 1,2-cyclic phosphodiesterase